MAGGVVVDAVLAATGLDGDALVARDGESLALAEWLRDKRELSRIGRPLLFFKIAAM